VFLASACPDSYLEESERLLAEEVVDVLRG